jgi:hypothetical protein
MVVLEFTSNYGAVLCVSCNSRCLPGCWICENGYAIDPRHGGSSELQSFIYQPAGEKGHAGSRFSGEALDRAGLDRITVEPEDTANGAG